MTFEYDRIYQNFRLQPLEGQEWDEDPNGRLLVWEPRKPNKHYVVGVDVSTGVGLTNSVVHVLKVGSVYEPYEQVAEFACNFIDPHSMAPILNMIGNDYRNVDDDMPALMCIECNNAGEATQYDLMTIFGYTNIYIWKVYDKGGNILTNRLGWWTTPRTRRKIVLNGSRLLKSGMWHINSPWFIDEMADFELVRGIGQGVTDPEIEEASGRHSRSGLDDRLFAGFIAAWCAEDLRDADYEDPSIERQRFLDRQQEQLAREKAGEARADFQNTAVSYAKMQEMADSW